MVIAGIIAILLLVAAFTKKECHIEKTVLINKPKQEVFNYLKLIKNQEEYSVWVMKDPNINILYTGTDGTVGFTSSWTSNDKNVGIGEQEIIELKNGDNMKVEIRFTKPFKATNYATTTLTSSNGQTLLSQVFSGKSTFPMNIKNLFMDKLIGKDMQQNLNNLKQMVEG